MAALAEEKVLHRHLSCNSVLVFGFDMEDVSKVVVKESDYGMNCAGSTRYVYSFNNLTAPFCACSQTHLQACISIHHSLSARQLHCFLHASAAY